MLPVSVGGQTLTSATVTGTVRDVSTAIAPAALVEIRRDATNEVRQAVTDDRGRFTLLYLPVGEYRLSVTLDGFAPSSTDLTLTVGQQLDLTIVLRPALQELVQVEASSPLIEARRTGAGAEILRQEIEALPLNGRNYLDLATLVPNVSKTNLRSTDRFAETSAVPGTGISVSGQRNLDNTFIIDGLSANDDAAGLAGTFYSEEVIREFQIGTSGGVAEFGRASSGVVNIVTQSGTNRVRGRAYEFFRDSALDARSPLSSRRDSQSGEARKDPLRQHQYGVSLSGPLVRDSAFWFGNIERTQLDRTGFVTVAPASASAVNAVLDASGYRGPRLTTGDFATGYDTTTIFGRFDHHRRSGSQINVRYSLYDLFAPHARNVGGLNATSRSTRLENRDHIVGVSHVAVLGQPARESSATSAIHEVRAQYSRSRLDAPATDLVGPAVNIAGIASFGTATSSPAARALDVMQWVDTLTVQRGAHLLKAGVDALYNQLTIDFPGPLRGLYSFSSLAAFERGVYTQYQQAFGTTRQFQRNPNLGVFLQDEWRPAPALTMNAGVRYDLQWLPAPLRLDTDNVSPRLGVAFAPGSGRTVMRASAGLYFDRVPLRAVSNALQRDGAKYRTAVLSAGQAAAPTFPHSLPAFPESVLASTTTINPEIQNGRSAQWSVEIERALGRAWTATVGYSGLRGEDIIMSRNINVPTLSAAEAAAGAVANLGRPDSRFGNIGQYDSLGRSWFDSLSASVIMREMAWGRARLSYTFSRSLDTAGNAFFQTPQDSTNLAAEKGPSDNDQRHRLVVSGSIGDGSSERLRRVLAGLQLGYVFSYASAAPFTPQAGVDLNNDTTLNDRPAGMGRNSDRLPCMSNRARRCGTATLDVRVSRAFSIKGQRVEVMAEAFNLFNRVNVVNVNTTFGSGLIPLSTYRQVTAIGDMRQVQLGLRFDFGG